MGSEEMASPGPRRNRAFAFLPVKDYEILYHALS